MRPLVGDVGRDREELGEVGWEDWPMTWNMCPMTQNVPHVPEQGPRYKYPIKTPEQDSRYRIPGTCTPSRSRNRVPRTRTPVQVPHQARTPVQAITVMVGLVIIEDAGYEGDSHGLDPEGVRFDRAGTPGANRSPMTWWTSTSTRWMRPWGSRSVRCSRRRPGSRLGSRGPGGPSTAGVVVAVVLHVDGAPHFEARSERFGFGLA